jgi:2,3-bisphosphoglycerate-dependent phosphoglycerate mutase
VTSRAASKHGALGRNRGASVILWPTVLLYLIRHAQSERNAGVPGSPIDCALTATGRRQAAAVGQRVAELGVDWVLSSPYVRTLETAEAVRRATGAPGAIVPLLHEHHVEAFPQTEDWPLLSRVALAERYPGFQLPDDFAADSKWHDVPETHEGVLRRARGVLAALWERYALVPQAPPVGAQPRDGQPDARLAVVSHGSPTGKLLMAALRLESPAGIEFRIDNASLSIVEYWPDWRVVEAINRVDHLADITPAAELRKGDPGYPSRRP